MVDMDTFRAWVKTHFVRKRDLVNSTVQVGGLALTLKSYTIATGAITLSMGTGVALADSEAAAATDDLDTVSGGIDNQLLLLRAFSSARTVVAKDGTGNLLLAGDCTLDNAADVLLLYYYNGFWREISRSDNAV